MKLRNIILMFFAIIILLHGLVTAADFTPQGNINLRDVYNITGAPYINATLYYGNGSQLTGLVVGPTNYSTFANSTEYWGDYHNTSDINNLITIQGENISGGTINFARLPTLTNLFTLDWSNITNKIAADFNYLILSKWQNITGRPTVLSNFTDDLGNRGYTDLLNFTNGPGYVTNATMNSTVEYDNIIGAPTVLSNFTDDLGNRGYTSLTNFSNDLGIGNWSDDESNYYNSTQTDTQIEDANTSVTNWVDELFVRFTEIVGLVGNFSAWDKSYADLIYTPTLLSNFSDDLGDRGYTDLLNFTNGPGYVTNDTMNKTVDYSDVTGEPTYLSNFTNNLGIGNWTADQGNYYNSTQTDTAIESANTSMKTYTDNTFITQANEGNLNVNSSDYWDNLGSPSDINASNINDDGVWRLQAWDNFTGIPVATPSDSDITHLSTADQIFDYIVSLSYISASGIVGLVGNWSDDKADYSTTTAANLLYSTIDEPIWDSNSSTVARTGDCPTGEFVKNITISGVECEAAAGGGTVTSVDTDGVYLTGGPITSTGTITFNDTKLNETFRLEAWDNFTGIPHAAPADNDVTHFSWGNDIYDWAVGLFMQNLVDDSGPQLGGDLDANGNDIGSTTDEIENIYIGTTTRIYFGDGQEASMYYNGTKLIISG